MSGFALILCSMVVPGRVSVGVSVSFSYAGISGSGEIRVFLTLNLSILETHCR